MKIRLSIWGMLVGATAFMVTLVVWHYQPPPPAGPPAVPASPVTPPTMAVARMVPPPTPAVLVASAPLQCSDQVKVITDENAGFQARRRALLALGGKLSEADLAALYDFLRQRGQVDDQQAEQVLKNELMNALCQLQPPPAGLRELLTQVYQNPDQDGVLRDYAVQHLTAFYQQMDSATAVDAQVRDDELAQTRQTLWTALANTDSSIAGTALLGLSQLAQAGWPGIDPQQVSAAALKLAADDGAGDLTRITALQVCGSLGVKDALPVVWNAAQPGGTVPVEISAIAALGALGDAGQIPFLNSLLQGDNDRLRLPAQQALNQINARLKAGGKAG